MLTRDGEGYVNRRELMGLAGLVTGSGIAASLSIDTASSATPKSMPPNSAATSKLPWPSIGSFGGKAIVAPYQAGPALMIDTKEVLGLDAEFVAVYSNLRDESGMLSVWGRNLSKPEQGLFVQQPKGDALRIVPDFTKQSTLGYQATVRDGVGIWEPPAGATGKPFRLTMSSDGSTIRWHEEAGLDLTGQLLGPALQWYVPDQRGGQFFASQIYDVRGTVLGRKVRGMVGMDKCFLRPDQPLYTGKDPLFRPDSHHRTWYTWGTRYTDGSYDTGHFLLGPDRMNFAAIANERQEPVLDTDVTGDVQLVTNGVWPQQITIKRSNGDHWRFTPDPMGRMPDLLAIGMVSTPQTAGLWTRVGDTRVPENWFAFGEVGTPTEVRYRHFYRY